MNFRAPKSRHARLLSHSSEMAYLRYVQEIKKERIKERKTYRERPRKTNKRACARGPYKKETPGTRPVSLLTKIVRGEKREEGKIDKGPERTNYLY